MANLITKQKQGTLLANTRRRLLQLSTDGYIAVSFYTHIPVSWLKKVAHGHIKNPSVNRIQKVYEYTTGKKLC